MLLENRYYRTISRKTDGQQTVFRIAILPECDVYKGHFPGDPVCPGVCNIETIKECASAVAGRPLRITTIKQCRLTAIATPAVCPEADVTVTVANTADDTYSVQATIADAQQTYMTFKGTMEADKKE
ncbi:MAG: beta-hydroxyacyl-ACP dehydratase [Prevotellaceae bacterium]|nr:beta-hydroxyacyl-ACP dehydratase [Prevotellaceae bacterium]MDO4932726.1 beta-hydroxyacyl-ACP dehydratase [Prevotellaceae bacterium]